MNNMHTEHLSLRAWQNLGHTTRLQQRYSKYARSLLLPGQPRPLQLFGLTLRYTWETSANCLGG